MSETVIHDRPLRKYVVFSHDVPHSKLSFSDLSLESILHLESDGEFDRLVPALMPDPDKYYTVTGDGGNGFVTAEYRPAVRSSAPLGQYGRQYGQPISPMGFEPYGRNWA